MSWSFTPLSFAGPPASRKLGKLRRVEAIRALQGQIPGLLATYVGTNTSPRSQGHELGVVMHFADTDALLAYNTHPAHQTLLAWLMPLVQPIEVDFDPER